MCSVTCASTESTIALIARIAHGKVVDHVVALQLPVGNDVDTRNLLILDGCLSNGVVHFLEVVAADAPLQVIVLGAFQPLGHRVTADYGGRENSHSHQSRCVVY